MENSKHWLKIEPIVRKVRDNGNTSWGLVFNDGKTGGLHAYSLAIDDNAEFSIYYKKMMDYVSKRSSEDLTNLSNQALFVLTNHQNLEPDRAEHFRYCASWFFLAHASVDKGMSEHVHFFNEKKIVYLNITPINSHSLC
ncbi:hypothetical protein [Photobacterium kishitanii]|uniref:Uncharacterized protein n=1 Tax=Photobacterium kishitanii TaxID=318456 RepID=A0A2T3KLA8_9GAMM|nr:hypothetical protein [Photobacterium kishitanii]PSV00505.1 hypothetical protein C9J27_05055 [Photobacterium kishitanii]